MLPKSLLFLLPCSCWGPRSSQWPPQPPKEEKRSLSEAPGASSLFICCDSVAGGAGSREQLLLEATQIIMYYIFTIVQWKSDMWVFSPVSNCGRWEWEGATWFKKLWACSQNISSCSLQEQSSLLSGRWQLPTGMICKPGFSFSKWRPPPHKSKEETLSPNGFTHANLLHRKCKKHSPRAR